MIDAAERDGMEEDDEAPGAATGAVCHPSGYSSRAGWGCFTLVAGGERERERRPRVRVGGRRVGRRMGVGEPNGMLEALPPSISRLRGICT